MTEFFAHMQTQRTSGRTNPFSGRDPRGFQRGRYSNPVWKRYCIELISKELPAGWSVQKMYYAPEFAPDPVVKLFLLTAGSLVVEHEIRVPLNAECEMWGRKVPEVLRDFVRLTYA